MGDRKKVYQWSLRNWVQTAVFLLTLAIGIQFALFIHQVEQGGPVTVQRPPGLEGFLPIGSLIGWKRFFLEGVWDHVHPAGMVILGFAILVSFLWKKSFCGWFCPVGTVSEYLWRIGRKGMGKNYLPPKWIDIPLRSIKYLLLAFFGWAVIGMDGIALRQFVSTPYWKISDVKMLHFFTQMTALTAIVLLGLGVGSLFIRNFWCRYGCPYGALLGIIGLVSPTRIKRNVDTCIDCRLCAKACPAYLPVDKKSTISSAECTGCTGCTDVCPIKDTLGFETVGLKKQWWSTRKLAWIVPGLFVVLVILARWAGVWESSLSIAELQELLPMVTFFSH